MREILTAFTVIFIGEFGDLTQIQAANFSAKTHRPIEVFVDASLAMISVSFVGAYGGRMLQRVVPLARIRLLGGVVFLGLGIYTLVQLIRV
jgi:putative Ca2+/H+ antiporter (TMEM165/GDT1 family)